MDIYHNFNALKLYLYILFPPQTKQVRKSTLNEFGYSNKYHSPILPIYTYISLATFYTFFYKTISLEIFDIYNQLNLK